MSDLLTVATNFGSISELAQGLADRIEGEQLILYGPSSYSEGDEIPFAVLLADGSPAIAGVGRVAASVDGGEERAPETRFDVILDSLRLEPRAEVVYERILLELQPEGDPTGQIALDKVESEVEEAALAPDARETVPPEASSNTEDAKSAFAANDASAPEPEEYAVSASDDAWPVEESGSLEASADAELDALTEGFEAPVEFAGEVPEPSPTFASEPPSEAAFHEPFEPSIESEAAVEPTVATVPPAAASVEGLESPPRRPAPAAPVSPGGFELPTLANGGAPILSRPARPAAWSPMAAPEPVPEPEGEIFAYGAGQLPVPARPPRPDLDSSLRVSPAPRPAADDSFAYADVAEEPVALAAPKPERAESLEDSEEFADGLELEGVEAERQWED